MKLTKLFSQKSPFEDQYFLKLTQAKDTAKETQKIAESFEAKENLHLPYLTFKQAEKLFFAATANVEDEQAFGALEVVFNNKGSLSTDDEIIIKDFWLTSDYQGVLKVLSEAMFNMTPYSSYEFDDQITYLKTIFKAWSESTDLDSKNWPILPDFEPYEDQYVEIMSPDLTQAFNQEVTQETTQEVTQNVAQEITQVSTQEDVYETEAPEPPKEVETEGAGVVPVVEAAPDVEANQPEQIAEEPTTFVRTIVPAPQTTAPVAEEPRPAVSVPAFVFEATIFTLTDIPSVDEEILEQQAKVQKVQQSIFDKRMSIFEATHQADIAKEIEAKDSRQSKADDIVAQAKQELSVQLSQTQRAQLDAKAQAIEEEQKRHEARLKEISLDSARSLEAALANDKTNALQDTETRINEVISEETAMLNVLLDSRLQALEADKAIYAEHLSGQLHGAGEEVMAKTLDKYSHLIKYKDYIAETAASQSQELQRTLEEVNRKNKALENEVEELRSQPEPEPVVVREILTAREVEVEPTAQKVTQETTQEITQLPTQVDTQEVVEEDVYEVTQEYTQYEAEEAVEPAKTRTKMSWQRVALAAAATIALGAGSVFGGYALVNQMGQSKPAEVRTEQSEKAKANQDTEENESKDSGAEKEKLHINLPE